MNYTKHRWPREGRAHPRWIIVHDPGNDAASPGATLAFLRNNARQSSYHKLAWMETGGPKISVLAPPHEWVGHAGVATRIPRTLIANRQVNLWTVSLSICTYGKPVDSALFNAVVRDLAATVRELNMPDAGVILAHREISTVRGRRTDPRGIDMDELRRAVASELRKVQMRKPRTGGVKT